MQDPNSIQLPSLQVFLSQLDLIYSNIAKLPYMSFFPDIAFLLLMLPFVIRFFVAIMNTDPNSGFRLVFGERGVYYGKFLAIGGLVGYTVFHRTGRFSFGVIATVVIYVA